jgi:hypothetical protein
VHALLSSQVVPSSADGLEQAPVVVLQVPATWHWSLAVQMTAVPRQTPAWQWSAVVQALVSLQVVVSLADGLEQAPVVGLQVPATWHWSLAVQTTAVPRQTPASHWSVVVQALPSLQIVVSLAVGLEQVPVAGLQTPTTWHASLAVQTTGVPRQTPA